MLTYMNLPFTDTLISVHFKHLNTVLVLYFLNLKKVSKLYDCRIYIPVRSNHHPLFKYQNP